tara:strand:- start:905 stop:1228 length:324 start_codon:yes stop_codon:yes gene_type:complete
MKISKNELKKMIAEELNGSSVLLEMPQMNMLDPASNNYEKDPDGYEGNMAKRSLYHMAAQAQQLHDMLHDDENLEPWVQAKITKAADYLEKAFKSISYEKGPGKGKL